MRKLKALRLTQQHASDCGKIFYRISDTTTTSVSATTSICLRANHHYTFTFTSELYFVDNLVVSLTTSSFVVHIQDEDVA